MDRLANDEVETVEDLLVTTPSRTAFDMGRYLKRAAALARLDALMRAAPFPVEGVELLMHRYGPVRGVRQLRDLLPLIDAGAESPKESWLRLLLIDAGLPAPETQIPILEGGVPVAYLDMGYRDSSLPSNTTVTNTAATVVNTSETFDVYRWLNGTGGKSFGSSRKTEKLRCYGGRGRPFFAALVPRSELTQSTRTFSA